MIKYLEVSIIIVSKLDKAINENIRDKEIRLIGQYGEPLGIMSALEANKVAEEQDLDLVKIAPYATPPVCKIMDYSKYRYEQKKREKEAKKKQKVIEVKEIRMSPNIDDNDFATKLKAARKFLEAGDRVKVSVHFRGREVVHTNIGDRLIKRFAQQCSDLATYDKTPVMENKSLTLFLIASNK